MTAKDLAPNDLSELLIAKLCHDMAGPVGAMCNGVELLEDEVPGDSQAISLLQMSAHEARAKLQLFRQAYGAINNAEGFCELVEVKELLEEFFKFGKTKLNWPLEITEDSIDTVDFYKRRLFLNLILLASGMLIGGGELKIIFTEKGFEIQAEGPRLKVEDELKSLLNGGNIGEISVKHIMPYFLTLLLKQAHATLNWHVNDTKATFNISYKV